MQQKLKESKKINGEVKKAWCVAMAATGNKKTRELVTFPSEFCSRVEGKKSLRKI